MKVLVTGCAGLIGGQFCDWILKHTDAEVIGIDDLSSGYLENIPVGVQFHRISLGAGDPRLRELCSGSGVDIIFHFAAYAAEGLSPFIRTFNYRSNLLATAELVNEAIRCDVKRFVFTSSIAAYGQGRPPFSEQDPCNPIDPYGVAKLASELDIKIAGEQHGLPWVIIRPHNIYGPGQSIWNGYRNVFGIWMARHLSGQPLLIHGDGLQERAFSFIDDCLPCFWNAAILPEAVNRTINLGSSLPSTVLKSAQLLIEIMGGGELQLVEPRHEVKAAWCTTELSTTLLKYRECTALADGLAVMWSWAQEAWRRFPERRDSHVWAELELERGLYSYWAPRKSKAPDR